MSLCPVRCGRVETPHPQTTAHQPYVSLSCHERAFASRSRSQTRTIHTARTSPLTEPASCGAVLFGHGHGCSTGMKYMRTCSHTHFHFSLAQPPVETGRGCAAWCAVLYDLFNSTCFIDLPLASCASGPRAWPIATCATHTRTRILATPATPQRSWCTEAPCNETPGPCTAVCCVGVCLH